MLGHMDDSMTDSPASAPDAWIVKVLPGSASELKDRLLRLAEASGTNLLILRADMTFGLDHITSALYHARKAFTEKRNSSDSLAMETLLYASGERQLSSAIGKMGVRDDTKEVVVIRLVGGEFSPEIGWKTLAQSDPEAGEERYLKFGISREELGTVRRELWPELVLEKVATVDIIKR